MNYELFFIFLLLKLTVRHNRCHFIFCPEIVLAERTPERTDLSTVKTMGGVGREIATILYAKGSLCFLIARKRVGLVDLYFIITALRVNRVHKKTVCKNMVCKNILLRLVIRTPQPIPIMFPEINWFPRFLFS